MSIVFIVYEYFYTKLLDFIYSSRYYRAVECLTD